MPTIGMPKINIEFTSLGLTAIQRSQRGIVAMLLQDDTQSEPITVYNRFTDVIKADWSTTSYDYLRMTFLGAPYRVIAIRAVSASGSVDWTETGKRISTQTFNYLCAPDTASADQSTLVGLIKDLRDKDKRTVKMAAANTTADHEGIINFTASNIQAKWSADEAAQTYTTIQYTARIAGILAGIPLSRSATYFELPEVVSVDLVLDMDAAVNAGKLFVFNDGRGYKLSRGVNSLTSYTATKGSDFGFIKIIEALDLVLDDITITFHDYYVGKVINSYDNKQQFVAAINSYFRQLEGDVLDSSAVNLVAISLEGQRQYLEQKGISTEDMADIEILRANTSTFVFLAGSIKPVNAMEDLDLKLDI